MKINRIKKQHKHTDTSLAAYLHILEVSDSLRARVWEFIKEAGPTGVIDQEIQHALDLGPQTETARRGELLHAGLVYDSGERRKTSSGRWAIVWKAIET